MILPCLQSQAIGHNFWDILYSRLGLGITESLAAPACYALIAAYFPMAERGAANGVYSCGIYIGGGLASLSILIARSAGWRMACVIVGGIGIAIGILLLCTVKEPKESSPDARVDASASADDAHAQSFALLHREDSALLEGSTADDEHTPSLPPNEVTPIVRRSRGGSFEDHAAVVPVPLLSQSAPVVSQVGRRVLCGVKVLSRRRHRAVSRQELLRPETVSVARRPQDNSMTVNREPVTLSQSFRAILSRKVVLLLYAAGCMRFIGGNAIGSFLVKYFQAAFPAHNKDYSVVNAVVIGVGGALSSAGGGYLADFLSRKYGYHVRAFLLLRLLSGSSYKLLLVACLPRPDLTCPCLDRCWQCRAWLVWFCSRPSPPRCLHCSWSTCLLRIGSGRQ
jgi:MFS family permease